MNTVVADTMLVLAAGRILPGYVADVLEGDGSAFVPAGHGPAVDPVPFAIGCCHSVGRTSLPCVDSPEIPF